MNNAVKKYMWLCKGFVGGGGERWRFTEHWNSFSVPYTFELDDLRFSRGGTDLLQIGPGSLSPTVFFGVYRPLSPAKNFPTVGSP